MRSSALAVVLLVGLGGPASAQTTAPHAVQEIGTVSGTVSPFGTTSVDVPVELNETTGTSVELVEPAFISLKRDSGAGAVAIALPPVEIRQDDKPVTTVSLKGYSWVSLVVRVKGLTEPGTYTAQLVFGTASGAEVKAPVTIKLRSSGVVAWLLILAGVVLSAWLRHLVMTYRDSLRTRARIGLLSLRLRQVRESLGELSAAEKRAVDAVENQVGELSIRLEAEDRPVDAQLDECARKIPGVRSYVHCSRRLSDVDDRSALDIVLLWLDTEVDDAEVASRREAAETALTELTKAINALASPLGRQISALHADIDGLLEAARHTGRTEAVPAFEQAGHKLADARAVLVSDQDDAKRLYEEAKAIRDQHGGSLGSTSTVPVPAADEPMSADTSNPLKAIGTKTRRADLIVTAAVAVIAVLLGLQLLYVNQLAWGTPLDKITAFLWGLGLHPVGGTVFGGLDALRERVSSGPAKE